MIIDRKKFIGNMLSGGAAVAAGAALGDEFAAADGTLPPGSCGDPDNVWFGKHIFPLEPTMADGPSCFLKDGRVIEPAKEIPVFRKTDVVVVGGGPAGFAAAIGAARAGAKVALVERYGSLGGLFTNGMVLIMLSTSRREESGRWTLVTRGVCEEFMERSCKYGKAFCNPPASTLPGQMWQPTVDPEWAKVLMDEMAAEAGVELFFHSWGVDVIQEGGAVKGVVFESKEGRQAVLASQVVDCTGDADMLFKAGGGYSQVTSPISTVFRWANMDTINPPKGSSAMLPRRGNEGNPDAHWGHCGMETGNALSVRDLSRLEVEMRRRNWEQVLEMRSTPGWENVYTSNSASQIGVRQSRLVDAEFVIGREEIRKGLDFDDVVGWCGHDHSHAAFPVCYRQILPKKIDNLLCAGRCLGKGDTIDTFRLICPCFVTGHAAGVAAALSARKGVAPRALSPKVLKDELLRQKAYL